MSTSTNNNNNNQNNQRRQGMVLYTTVQPTTYGPLSVSAWTHIGKRNNQEDRLVVCPNLCNGEYAFFGVFDGTVKEHASEFVHKTIINCLLNSAAFNKFDSLSREAKLDKANKHLLAEAIQQTYAATDSQLLEWCRDNEIHYSSTTAVTVFIHNPSQRLWAAHLGDSKIVLGQALVNPTSPDEELSGDVGGGGGGGGSSGQSGSGGSGGPSGGNVVSAKSLARISGVALTLDHKPDQPDELRRIEASGGSLTYLHGGKPFIRGGDFSQRQRAMQLNYSRAFGGKDLKMYGLSAVPSICEVKINKHRERLVVLGSDGIWDVIDPDTAAKVGEQARRGGLSAAEELGKLALRNHDQRGSADNVTAIVVFLNY